METGRGSGSTACPLDSGGRSRRRGCDGYGPSGGGRLSYGALRITVVQQWGDHMFLWPRAKEINHLWRGLLHASLPSFAQTSDGWRMVLSVEEEEQTRVHSLNIPCLYLTILRLTSPLSISRDSGAVRCGPGPGPGPVRSRYVPAVPSTYRR